MTRSTGPRILIVDDEPGIRRYLVRLLKPTASVVCASDADEAASMLEGCEYDAVISDYRMPSGLGTELLAEVGRRMPRALRVLISANDIPTEPTTEPTWDVFLAKPFANETLLAALAPVFANG